MKKPLFATKSAKSLSPMQIHQGRLTQANWMASSNFNARPEGTDISLIVIHNISLPPDQFKKTDVNGLHYVKAFFTNSLDWEAHPYFKTIEGMQVSTHLFIERSGEITQFVNFEDRAWHAGRSSYLGKTECNDYSIGIELEGSDNQPFTKEQYMALASAIAAIYKAYPKTHRHLIGHSDIAPGRKTDPGKYFEWNKLRDLVGQRNT
ncbi:1,6-anhydro-N-acetylmuramyl-L-alanine amidase AmpD [Psychrobacter sp.]|uniref:1,6-anhydro-N-acetylmuramyl-L-alanine amidase AmpD n=1 Tax=Psychrobacter sp. TaxID=56811 RepID=UPI0025ED5AFD|nr:1,6-anhydro-N-acetylmuramyl-L-alanine amidase AmpD [Psychrobacter sp.]